jgi:hypothetical protein
MNSKKAVETIMKVLGLTPQKFFESKTEQGLAIKMEGELEVGQKVYVATEEGLIPAPPGVHKLEDGMALEVDDEGNLVKIDMGDYEKTMDEKKEEEIDKESIKDETMAEKFSDVKLVDGSIMRVGADEAIVGTRVRKISYDNTLVAMADGDYETEDVKVISVVGCSIQGVQPKADYEKRKTGFTIAETPEGVKVESPSFDVGEDISVLDGDEKKMAPDGEHQIVLKDESGNETKIRVISKDGKIVERENVEQEDMEKTMMEIAEQFQKALSKFESKIDLIAQKQKELETKFSKFSKEPAGSRVFTQKTINETPNPLTTKYEGFRKLRQDLGVK